MLTFIYKKKVFKIQNFQSLNFFAALVMEIKEKPLYDSGKTQ